MRKSGLAVGFLVVFLAACKGTDGTGPPVTTTVQVSSSPNQIAVGETAQASAIVKDQNGNPLTGKTITWTSLNQGVATVSSGGIIMGVAPGSATIQGSVDGITGSATIIVVAPVPSCLSGPTVIDLAPGEVKVLSSLATDGCIQIAATSGSSSYVVIGASLESQPDILSTYAVRSDEAAAGSGNLLMPPFSVTPQVGVEAGDQPGELQAAFEARLRRTERRDLKFVSGQKAYAARETDPRLRTSVSMAIPSVGDPKKFNVPKSCTSFVSVNATVKVVSTRAIIYTDDASPAGGFTDSDLQAIATEFDTYTYPTDTDYFGTPLDLDNNSRIIILYTPEVNKLTPQGASGFVGGFFFAGDLFPTSDCQQSNVAELFYVLSPDPNGTINENKRSTSEVRQGTRGTIAHEFQHMINASGRIRSTAATDFEDVWLDEALAHFAEDLNGRVQKGLNDTGNYTFSQLASSVPDYNAFFFQNFARLRQYLLDPGPNAPTSALSDTSLADRGASWSLLHYTADHYSPAGDIKAFIRSVAAGPGTGVPNLMSKINNVIPFDTLIAGWMVANYADDAGIAGLATRYTYKTYNMRDNLRNISSQVYPLQVTAAGPGVLITDIDVRSASGNYFSISRNVGAPARTFKMLNANLSDAASFSGASLIVLRIN
jgi:hypothetical protein